MFETRYAFAAFAAAVGLALAAPASAQTNTSVSGGITVFAPSLIVTKNSDLSFGSVTRPTSGNGTITIDPNSGNVTSSGGISLEAKSILVHGTSAGKQRRRHPRL